MTPSTSPHNVLMIIDAQNSFCHPEQGELYVPGAENDMDRLADFLKQHLTAIDMIVATLDSHHEFDVAHPIFWQDAEGHHPEPFTIISKDDVINGVWKPYAPEAPSPPYGSLQERMIEYVTQLEQGGRYQLTIWPPHCRIGTFGHILYESLQQPLQQWEQQQYRPVNYIIKGVNSFTENYSGVQADVPDPDDPDTHLNTHLIRQLDQADRIMFGGEAASHCVANTVRDLATHFSDRTVKRCVLFRDAMSPVPNFEDVAKDFYRDMEARGMTIATTTAFSPE